MAQAYGQNLVFASYDEDNHFRYQFRPGNGSVTLTNEDEHDFEEFIYEMLEYLEKFQDIPSFSCEMLGLHISNLQTIFGGHNGAEEGCDIKEEEEELHVPGWDGLGEASVKQCHIKKN